MYGDGGLYEGEWEKDQRHGTHSSAGERVSGLRCFCCSHAAPLAGFGTMTYASGEKYQGQWVEDRKEGTGTYAWRQGQYLYSGQWKNGQVRQFLCAGLSCAVQCAASCVVLM